MTITPPAPSDALLSFTITVFILVALRPADPSRHCTVFAARDVSLIDGGELPTAISGAIVGCHALDRCIKPVEEGEVVGRERRAHVLALIRWELDVGYAREVA